MRLIHLIVGTALVCGGCGSGSPRDLAAAEPVGGLKAAAERSEYSAEQLIQIDLANIAFADWYLARLAAACDVLAQEAETPEARYQALRLKSAQAESVYATVTGSNPFVQALNLQMLSELTHLKWVEEGKAAAVFGEGGKLLTDALEEMRKRSRANALRVIPEQEVNAIRGAVRDWRAANREIVDVEFIRSEDFLTELARSLAPEQQTSLMASIRSAATGMTESRLLGMRALGLMSRFPRMMQWQVEAQMANVARRRETRALLEDVSEMAGIGELLKRLAGEMQVTADAFPQKLAAQFQGTMDAFPQKLADSLVGGPQVKEALALAKEGAARAEAVTAQMAAIEASVRALDGSVVTLGRQLEKINQDYDPATVQKMALDVKLSAVDAARSLVYLVTGCMAGLVVLQAVLRRRKEVAGVHEPGARRRSLPVEKMAGVELRD